MSLSFTMIVQMYARKVIFNAVCSLLGNKQNNDGIRRSFFIPWIIDICAKNLTAYSKVPSMKCSSATLYKNSRFFLGVKMIILLTPSFTSNIFSLSFVVISKSCIAEAKMFRQFFRIYVNNWVSSFAAVSSIGHKFPH